MENISLSIDGNSIICSKGSTIFNAAQEHGIKIPNLCNHHSLKPFGACRLCVVEDETSGRVLASCVAPAAQDMVILTDTPRIKQHRRNIVRLMIAEHPESCIVCSKGNRCQLRNVAAQLGIGETNLYPIPNYRMLEQANPFIVRDHSKCILCGRCVRADHELVVTGAIDFSLRGFHTRPVTAHDLPLEHSSCTFCGTCVSICPTGALSTKSAYIGTPERESISICGFCGVGCSLSMGAEHDKIVDVNPAHLIKSVNDATLCVRGHFANDFLNSNNRLTQPLIRKDNELIAASWDEALQMVVDKFLATREKTGPQSLAFLGSSKCTNEENYLFQKIARVIFQTNNIDNGGYVTGRHFLSMIDDRRDPVGRFNFFAGPLAGLEKAEVIFVIGADPDQSVPVVSYYLKRGARDGTPIIVAHPRRTELVNCCSKWLPLANGDTLKEYDLDRSYLELINGLSMLLAEKETYDVSFIDRFTEGFSGYREGLSSLDINKISRITGIDIRDLQDAAELLKGKKISFVLGEGLFLNRYNIESMEALLNLSLMTGSIGYGGAGFYLMAAENNLVGAWDMGTVPTALPGRFSIVDEYAGKLWGETWKSEIPTNLGLNMVQIIKAAEEKKIKALYIMGENPLRSLPQHERVLNALQHVDFLVVQDILGCETTRIADVVLPGSAFSEKGGSFTNMGGKVQTFKPVIPSPADAKSDLEILCLLAEKAGCSAYVNTPEEIRREISKIISIESKVNGSSRSVWIKETDNMLEGAADGKKNVIQFSSVVSTVDEIANGDYPFTVLLGSLRFHLGSGTRTTRSFRISEFGLKGDIEISPDDCKRLGLNNGDVVMLKSKHGMLKREIRINNNLSSGLIFLPRAFHANDAMNLIGLTDLTEPDSGSWNSCRVKIEKI